MSKAGGGRGIRPVYETVTIRRVPAKPLVRAVRDIRIEPNLDYDALNGAKPHLRITSPRVSSPARRYAARRAKAQGRWSP